MSLVRLLRAGKSLVGGVDAMSRYQVSGQRLLPKFAPKRNPFRATTRPESAQAAAGAPAAAEPAPTKAALTAKKPTDQAGAANTQKQGWIPSLGRFITSLFNPVASWFQARPAKSATPAIPRFTKAAVQGELSLDSVKVVRNDLSESDLEVVPAKAPVAAPVPAPAEPVAEPVESAGTPRSLPSPRLLAAGKTLT